VYTYSTACGTSRTPFSTPYKLAAIFATEVSCFSICTNMVPHHHRLNRSSKLISLTRWILYGVFFYVRLIATTTKHKGPAREGVKHRKAWYLPRSHSGCEHLYLWYLFGLTSPTTNDSVHYPRLLSCLSSTPRNAWVYLKWKLSEVASNRVEKYKARPWLNVGSPVTSRAESQRAHNRFINLLRETSWFFCLFVSMLGIDPLWTRELWC